MEYKFREIEKKWQQQWRDSGAYKVSNDSPKPKFYVLDMFPYPSGAGLHVGHPLGYIASDIYARFKRLKGYNVLHPMGFDSFGLPAEQYAIETGQHPAETTKKNIARYKEQLDNIGFCYDWSREVQTSDPKYYKWTQWIFLQLFDSFYNRKTQKAERIKVLVAAFEQEGNASHICPGDKSLTFTSEQWKTFEEPKRQEVLMNYRIAFSAFGEVNWCEPLGTVLANDEVVNGVSERGGHPVVKKKMRQWYLRITEYADRLLQGLEQVDFSEAMKEMQRNWIGKSQGAEIEFRLTPGPSPRGEGSGYRGGGGEEMSGHHFKTANQKWWKTLKEYGRENRKNATEAENILWQRLRNNQLDMKVRRQHAIEGFIADFVFMEVKLVVEIDGEYHSEHEQQEYDEARKKYLEEFGFEVLRFTNKEVTEHLEEVIRKITTEIKYRRTSIKNIKLPLLREEKGLGDEATLKVYTTRPDTIFGVDFMVIAPEHELVQKITSPEQKDEIEKYLTYVKSRSERERLAEVKSITGAFTGAYAINPFDGREIPIWISEYVLAGYGTGAIMAVPCGDQRDYAFAKHFNIPITNIIGDAYNGDEANPTKDAVLQNSDFLNGMVMRDAIDVVIDKLEEMGIGKRQVNYRMRDAGFSRQRYWGEPFPIVYKGGVAYALEEADLPLELPYVDTYSAGPEGEGPLANLKEWVLIPDPSPQVEKGAPVQQASYEETDYTVEQHFDNSIPSSQVEKGAPVQQASYEETNYTVEQHVDNSIPSPQVEKGAPVQQASYEETDATTQQPSSIVSSPLSTRGEGPGVRGAALVPKYSVRTPMQYELAKQMRKGHTEAEAILWEALRGNKLGEKFRRQHPIDAYIADFMCLQKTLIVEVDGGYHENEEQQQYDLNRTKVLNEIGFQVIRFTNSQVMNDLASVIKSIKESLIPNPSPQVEKGAPVKQASYKETKIAIQQPKENIVISPLSTRGEGPGVRGVRETNTMPGYAGSSWYFLRYMDPHNDQVFVDRKAADYWGQVDLYIGGTEHAVGHLLYSRMWTKALYDLGYIGHDEPYKKLVNQGMIQGRSNVTYRFTFSAVHFEDGRVMETKDFDFESIWLSKNVYNSLLDRDGNLRSNYQDFFENIFDIYYIRRTDFIIDAAIQKIHIPIEYVDNHDKLNLSKLVEKSQGYSNIKFETEADGSFICDYEIEKMSKRWLNVVNPDDIVERYGADTFRMYEMFLGPVEQSKPWDTKGIEGVHRFLRKLWRLFVDDVKGSIVNHDRATDAESKVLHKTIKKIEEDTERFSFNTAVSAFMVCVNELNDLKCHKKEVLEPLVILLAPYAPHIAEELYQNLRKVSPTGGDLEGASVLDATFPKLEEKYLVESSKEYPVSINGKHRTNINISLDAVQAEVEQIVLANEVVQKWLEGKPPKKIIFVKGRMINVVI